MRAALIVNNVRCRRDTFRHNAGNFANVYGYLCH